MIRRVLPLGLGIAVLAVSATAGERAQSSGARKTEEAEVKKNAPESEAERVSLWNRILKDRQFDIFKSSLGGAKDPLMPAPTPTSPMMDPKMQKRLLEDLDRKKNWLVEPGSSTPRDFEKQNDPNAIPDFSRDRGQSPRNRDEKEPPDFSRGASRRSTDAKLEINDRDRSDRRDQSDLGSLDAKNRRDDFSRKDNESDAKELDASGWGGNKGRAFGDQQAASPRLTGTFDIGGGGRSHDFGTGIAADIKAFSTSSGGREFLNPFSDPSKTQSLGSDPFVDPGQRFDPSALPQSSFGMRDDGFVKPEAFSPAAAAVSAAGASVNAFGAEGQAAGGGIKALFTSPVANPVLQAPQQPAFVPRPAVLDFPTSKPF